MERGTSSVYETLFRTILEVSAAVTPLAAILLIGTSRLLPRYSGKLPSLLWLVLALRLLIPVNFTGGPLALPLPGEGQALTEQAGEIVLTEIPAAPDGFELPAAAQISGGLPIPQLLAGLWLAGTAAFLLWHLAAYLHTCRRLRRWRLPPAAEDVAALVCVKQSLGIRGGVRLYRSVVATGPLLIGFVRPCIMLPDTDFSPHRLRAVLRHELCHLRRGDLWYKLLMLLATAIHWFNPLVHLLARRADADLELACDSDALRGHSREERRDYGETVLQSLVGRAPGTPLTTCLAGNRRQMKRRFCGIMDASPKKRGLLPFAALLVAVFACSALVACGTAATEPALSSVPVARGSEASAWTYPVPGYEVITQPYGPRYGDSDFHTGVDYGGDGIAGETVCAASTGDVSYINAQNQDGVGYGKYIIIDHSDGIQTLYAHLDEIQVRVGDHIAAGSSIATVGQTGFATEPNLHFEIRVERKAIDPGEVAPLYASAENNIAMPAALPEDEAGQPESTAATPVSAASDSGVAEVPDPYDPDAESPAPTDEIPPEDVEMSFVWPTSGGYATTYEGHTGKGIDIAPGGAGHPIYATAAGTVTKVVNGYTGYGHYIMIDHGNGFVTLYGQNQENLVEIGEAVEQGQVIATMGRTGWATGNHLHFEVRYNGRFMDPTDFIGSRG